MEIHSPFNDENDGTVTSLSAGTGITLTPNPITTTGSITNNLLIGLSGGQTVIGGTGITDILKFKGTTGNGTLTSPAIQALVGNNGALYISAVTAGTSFTVTSTNALDTSNFNWFIIDTY